MTVTLWLYNRVFLHKPKPQLFQGHSLMLILYTSLKILIRRRFLVFSGETSILVSQDMHSPIPQEWVRGVGPWSHSAARRAASQHSWASISQPLVKITVSLDPDPVIRAVNCAAMLRSSYFHKMRHLSSKWPVLLAAVFPFGVWLQAGVPVISRCTAGTPTRNLSIGFWGFSAIAARVTLDW